VKNCRSGECGWRGSTIEAIASRKSREKEREGVPYPGYFAKCAEAAGSKGFRENGRGRRSRMGGDSARMSFGIHGRE
jgi:hypothetical protein